MKSNIIKFATSIFLVVVVATACNKKLNVLDSNNPTEESFFKTASELENAVNSVYSQLRGASLVAREWWYTHDLRGGECWRGGSPLESRRQEILFQPTPSPANSVTVEVWNGSYRMINRANVILAKAPAVTDNTALRNRVVAEAKFLRAWAYFELVSQWGAVPLYTEPVVSSVDFKSQSPAADVYALIVSDLNAAAATLPASYGSGDNGRATSGAANAMLGRVLMLKGDYSGAKTALLKLYNKYSLVPNYRWNFDGDVNDDNGTNIIAGHEFNSESIFEVVFYDRLGDSFYWDFTSEGPTSPAGTPRAQEYGITWGNVIPSNSFLNEFDDNDPRYKFTIWEEGDKILTESPLPAKVLVKPDMNIDSSIRHGVVLKRFFRKYGIYDWVNSGFHMSGINYRLIRYADVLLMLAECEAEEASPDFGKVAGYINEVRSRPTVNLPGVSFTSKNDALKAIMHERTVELGGEAIASIDIVRWRARGYYPSVRPDPVPNQISLFPIPATEVAANPLIK